MFSDLMNGKFELDVTHKIEGEAKKDLSLLAYNKLAIELTRTALEYKKKPSEVVAMFKEIRSGLLK